MGAPFEIPDIEYPDVSGAITLGSGTQTYNWMAYSDWGQEVADAAEATAMSTVPELAPVARISVAYGVPALVGAGVGITGGAVYKKGENVVNSGQKKLAAGGDRIKAAGKEAVSGHSDAVDVLIGEDDRTADELLEEETTGEYEDERSPPGDGDLQRFLSGGAFGYLAPAITDISSHHPEYTETVAQSVEPVAPELAATVRTSPLALWAATGAAAGLGAWGVGRNTGKLYESAKESTKDTVERVSDEAKGGYNWAFDGDLDTDVDWDDRYDEVKSELQDFGEGTVDELEGLHTYVTESRPYQTIGPYASTAGSGAYTAAERGAAGAAYTAKKLYDGGKFVVDTGRSGVGGFLQWSGELLQPGDDTAQTDEVEE